MSRELPVSSNPDSFGWCFENTYTQLPSEFFAVAEPVKVADAKLVVANHRLALELGLRLNDQPAGHLARGDLAAADGEVPSR